MSETETKNDAMFKLTQPLLTHKGLINELEFIHPPTANLFIKYGQPYYHADGVMRFDFKACFAFVSEMTGVDTILLSDIPSCDVMRLADFVVGKVVIPPRIG